MGVQDLDASIRLYRDGCGLAHTGTATYSPPGSDGATGCLDAARLGRPDVIGSAGIRLVRCPGPAGRSAGQTRLLGGLGTGFTTSDIHRLHLRLDGHGVRFLSPPLELSPEPGDEAGPRRFEAFSQTVDGEFIVLVERRRAPGPYGTIDPHSLLSEPLHTSHVVDDLDGCCRFMEEVLDHRVMFSEVCSGELFERLMAIEPGSSFRFRMLGHPERETGRIIFIEFDGEAREVKPDVRHPQRGLFGLSYRCDDLDRRVEAAGSLGVGVLLSPGQASRRQPGDGRRAVLAAPFGILLELCQRAEES